MSAFVTTNARKNLVFDERRIGRCVGFSNGAVCGRRPEGLVEHAAGAAIGVGAYFADAAYLEAASVVAFRRLETELSALGAPAGLVTRARASRADEVRHARDAARLARRFGGELKKLEVSATRSRSAFAIATENAVEGCVRETFGALVAAWQARTATDPEVRRVLEGVARDEARHAALAHDVAAWLEPSLTPSERAQIDAARERAKYELRAAVEIAPDPRVVGIAGMPTVAQARALLAELEREVLAAA